MGLKTNKSVDSLFSQEKIQVVWFSYPAIDHAKVSVTRMLSYGLRELTDQTAGAC